MCVYVYKCVSFVTCVCHWGWLLNSSRNIWCNKDFLASDYHQSWTLRSSFYCSVVELIVKEGSRPLGVNKGPNHYMCMHNKHYNNTYTCCMKQWTAWVLWSLNGSALVILNINIPVWHSDPIHPGGHVHWLGSVHVPPFRHEGLQTAAVRYKPTHVIIALQMKSIEVLNSRRS